MSHDKTSGVIVTNHSLVLQKISRQRSGIYVCEATNRVGRGRSQAIALDVKCKFLSWVHDKKMNSPLQL